MRAKKKRMIYVHSLALNTEQMSAVAYALRALCIHTHTAPVACGENNFHQFRYAYRSICTQTIQINREQRWWRPVYVLVRSATGSIRPWLSICFAKCISNPPPVRIILQTKLCASIRLMFKAIYMKNSYINTISNIILKSLIDVQHQTDRPTICINKCIDFIVFFFRIATTDSNECSLFAFLMTYL